MFYYHTFMIYIFTFPKIHVKPEHGQIRLKSAVVQVLRKSWVISMNSMRARAPTHASLSLFQVMREGIEFTMGTLPSGIVLIDKLLSFAKLRSMFILFRPMKPWSSL